MAIRLLLNIYVFFDVHALYCIMMFQENSMFAVTKVIWLATHRKMLTAYTTKSPNYHRIIQCGLAREKPDWRWTGFSTTNHCFNPSTYDEAPIMVHASLDHEDESIENITSDSSWSAGTAAPSPPVLIKCYQILGSSQQKDPTHTVSIGFGSFRRRCGRH